ncbi:MAG: hypothetical protein GX254_08950 [Clostridiales bacterium]|jgi:uncharacterized membrane-anchored protein|nr:hypothetical protein [Clostridiales bacterium]
MKKVKVIFLILLMLIALLTLSYTINKIIQSKPYAVSVLEEAPIDGRDGVRWKYG